MFFKKITPLGDRGKGCSYLMVNNSVSQMNVKLIPIHPYNINKNSLSSNKCSINYMYIHEIILSIVINITKHLQ